MKYEIVKQDEIEITWNTTNWISEFYIFTNSENVEIRTEYYSYDGRDLIGAVGGYFGRYNQVFNSSPVYMFNCQALCPF